MQDSFSWDDATGISGAVRVIATAQVSTMQQTMHERGAMLMHTSCIA